MKLKVCESPVYIHGVGKSVHIDIEHPILARVFQRGERAFCQGKGESGIFIALNREMAERARSIMAEATESRFQEAWQEIVRISREIGWERVKAMMAKAEKERAEQVEGDQEDAP